MNSIDQIVKSLDLHCLFMSPAFIWLTKSRFCGCEESQFAEFQTLQALCPLHFIEEQDWRRRCFVKSKMMWMKTEVGGRTEDVWFNIFPDKIRIIRPNQSG